MSFFRKIKLSDAIPHARAASRGKRHGPVPATPAEQVREAQESAKAHEAGPTNRERMVNIGRGNQQAGRQK
jgi:hypothetical protein